MNSTTVIDLLKLNSVPTDTQRFLAYLKKGNKPKKSSGCPDDIYKVIQNCLDLDKWKRKRFEDLHADFVAKVGRTQFFFILFCLIGPFVCSIFCIHFLVLLLVFFENMPQL